VVKRSRKAWLESENPVPICRVADAEEALCVSPVILDAWRFAVSWLENAVFLFQYEDVDGRSERELSPRKVRARRQACQFSLSWRSSGSRCIETKAAGSASRGIDGVRDSHRVRYQPLWLVRRGKLATSLVMRSVAVCLVRVKFSLSWRPRSLECAHK